MKHGDTYHPPSADGDAENSPPTDEIDLKDVPFAERLEESIPALCRMKVKCIGMVALLEDGSVATNYWEANGNDLFAMGGRLIEEGVLCTIQANGKMLKQAMEAAEREEDEEGGEDDHGA